MDRVRCVVERITYQNEQNGYTVIRLRGNGFCYLLMKARKDEELYRLATAIIHIVKQYARYDECGVTIKQLFERSDGCEQC